MTWVCDRRSDLPTQFFRALTITGWGGSWGLAVIGIFCINYFGLFPELNRLLERGLRALVAPGVAWVAVTLMKKKWRRPRPFQAFPDHHSLTWSAKDDSFPSGHAASCFAFLFAAAFILGGKAPPVFLPAVAVWATLVSFSRFYLGVHFLSDVVAGAFVGTLIGCGIGLALA